MNSAGTGRRVALVVCGWAATEFIQGAFVRGAADFAPDVRTIFVDGRESLSPRGGVGELHLGRGRSHAAQLAPPAW